ncbi:oligosaccharyl transferase, archaeosortase A system-associated [Halolamina salifodinae]|uniref:dolichyl-phosphooligosaccharide-protein glycotransferase n=1 Tax=Halolamina salifodinae TaxID=1202767 RepID=A0A8T4GTX8_9EURY|nr:oligosaccharyl transferase, archaeosortase A system-associated [Halolamina salifodinae]MBP1985602.1 dolichyl-diphosphooligosaccharide--protein glycosyltransferase [Halolamina salifodinae]
MSSRSESDDLRQSLLQAAEDWYHVPALLLAAAWMFWVRMQSYSNFIQNGEVFFSGNDAWYHLRQTTYSVRNFPSVMPFDIWTGFPVGRFAGQFGTLYDQLIALVVLIVGLGSPSDQLIGKGLLVAPPVFGALAVVPVYLIGKRFGNRIAGLFGVGLLALLPGSFLQRTLVGTADHNAAEPFFMALAMVGLFGAVAAANRTMPVWEVVYEEIVENRELGTIREPAIWSVLAGVLVGLFLWVWPPAVFLVGVIGLFLVVSITSDVFHGDTPEPVAFAGAVSMLVAALFSILIVDTIGFNITAHSLLQPLAALSVAAGAVFLCWLARYWEQEGIEATYYPAAVLGIAAVATLVVSVVASGLFSSITGNLLGIVGFSASAGTRTISEAQPFISPNSIRQYGLNSASERIVVEYGLTFFSGLLGVILLHIRPLLREGSQRAYRYLGASAVTIALIFLTPLPSIIGDTVGFSGQLIGLLIVATLIAGATLVVEYEATDLLFVVWAAFITSMAFTQVRFNYYLAIVVVVANAYLFARILGYLDFDTAVRAADLEARTVGLAAVPVVFGLLLLGQTVAAIILAVALLVAAAMYVEELEGHQVLTVAAVLLLVAAPVLAVPITVGGTQTSPGSNTATAVQTGNSTGPGAILAWEPTFDWMQNNTPEEGNLGGAGNADQMNYYGQYERVDDHSYPEGAYGVMSWWDYGHWITTQSERIPNANPFQQGATNAANYLLAPNETQAQTVLDRRAGEGEETRYVMVDYQMASVTDKFSAPVTFYDDQNVTYSDFAQRVYGLNETSQGQTYAESASQVYTQRYYESLMVRLYRYHGSAQNAQPIVVDWQERDIGSAQNVPSVMADEGMVQRYPNMSAARAAVENDSTAQVGGVSKFPSEDVPALQHYRLAKASAYQNGNFFANDNAQARMSGDQLYGLIYQQSRGTPSWVKTFEKVPGATIEGSNAPANTEVTASVEMRMPSSNETFVYTQHAQTNEDGEFTMTLPYSTTGYDEFGPENGYTNVSVRANSSYTITSPSTTNESGYSIQYGQQFNVSEGKVLGVDEGPKQITLEKRTQPPEGAQNGSDNTTNNTSDNTSDNSSSITGLEDLPTPGTDEGDVDGTTSSFDTDAAGTAPRVTTPALD